MPKFKTVLKLILLLPLLVLAFPFDGIVFALANSCSSCVSFQQYLVSNFSLVNYLLVSIIGLTIYSRKK